MQVHGPSTMSQHGFYHFLQAGFSQLTGESSHFDVCPSVSQHVWVVWSWPCSGCSGTIPRVPVQILSSLFFLNPVPSHFIQYMFKDKPQIEHQINPGFYMTLDKSNNSEKERKLFDLVWKVLTGNIGII